MSVSFPAVYLNKLKELFATKSHTHTKSQITDLSGSIGWPDYAHTTTVSNPYTATKNGYIWCFVDNDETIYIKRNGVEVVVFQQGEANQSSPGPIPVMSGDTIRCTGIHGNAGFKFCPCV